MDIHQINYLITIVDNDFNLTQSAKKLNISQPALSKFIAELEFIESINIFIRRKGRIVGLTPAGKDLVTNGRRVAQDYDLMMDNLRKHVELKKGTVRIGIAPVIISTLFSDAIPKFFKENPDIHIEIVEKGAYELQKLLIMQKIDIAFLVSPATFPTIEEKSIYKGTVSVWFNKNHRFNKIEGNIPLSELAKERIVTLDDSFMVTYQLKKLFKDNNLKPNMYFQTGSWDLILNICSEIDTVGVIASAIGNNYSNKTIVRKEFNPVFPWDISLCYLKDTTQTNLIKFTGQWFVNYFKKYF